MKRTAGLCVLLAGLSGCVSMDYSAGGSGTPPGESHAARPPSVPGVQGPWGQPVPMAQPYASRPPASAAEARQMMAMSLPLNMMHMSKPGDMTQPGGIPGAVAPAGMISPPGVPFAPTLPGAPVAAMPNAAPVGSNGIIPAGGPPGGVAGLGAITGPAPSYFPTSRTAVRFVGPAGMKVSWLAPGADGKPGFNGSQIETPGHYNFAQAAIYRLKLFDIPGHPGLELYPSLEVVPSNAKTDPFLAHSSVPVTFTQEDFEQVTAGNYVVKVIYLPNPQFQDLATTALDEIVSSRLEPGVDPIAEAHRRGNILLVIRLGNIDLEAPNTPAMDSPSPYLPKPAPPPAIPAGPPAPAGPGAGPVPPGMPGPGGMAAVPTLPPNYPIPGPMVPYDAVGTGKPLLLNPQGPPMMMTPNGLQVIPQPTKPPLASPSGPVAVPIGPGAGGMPVQPGLGSPPTTTQPSSAAPVKNSTPVATLPDPATVEKVKHQEPKQETSRPAETKKDPEPADKKGRWPLLERMSGTK